MSQSNIPTNRDILKQCREQIGLSLEQVQKKIHSIEKIEQGTKYPTFKQLDTLAGLYQVPRWVFISSSLPQPYRYESLPTFRQFKSSEVFDTASIRYLVAKVEQYRNLILELKEDTQEKVSDFQPLEIHKKRLSVLLQALKSGSICENRWILSRSSSV